MFAEIHQQERQLSTYWRNLHWRVCAVLAGGTAAAEILLFFVLDAALAYQHLRDALSVSLCHGADVHQHGAGAGLPLADQPPKLG